MRVQPPQIRARLRPPEFVPPRPSPAALPRLSGGATYPSFLGGGLFPPTAGSGQPPRLWVSGWHVWSLCKEAAQGPAREHLPVCLAPSWAIIRGTGELRGSAKPLRVPDAPSGP